VLAPITCAHWHHLLPDLSTSFLYRSKYQGPAADRQGLRDPNVTPENVHAVAGVLQGAGVEYQILAFEDEGHGIKRPKNQRTLYARLAEFFGDAFQG
jgi:Prolyl oligopeptidase family